MHSPTGTTWTDPPVPQHRVCGEASAPYTARNLVTAALGAEHPLHADACVVASELVTNAVRHSRSGIGGRIGLTIARLGAEGCRIDVLDDGPLHTAPTSPAPRRPTLHEASGRGLLIVAALASEWGTVTRPTGQRLVWARLGAVADGASDASPGD
ncbi:ATP-binding protein [Streptomonospora nanhaiensis]|uniref:ATP-binding protein n=1 Tax=Streptomonospora nanhaiensis TaxID=1323731 RepID=UPI003558B961|nr:ATP-binding protein [Streptomonospora nanhaiensis]